MGSSRLGLTVRARLLLVKTRDYVCQARVDVAMARVDSCTAAVSFLAVGLGACGPAPANRAESPIATSSVAPPTAEASSSAELASTAKPPPAPSEQPTTTPWPGVACDDSSAPSNLRFFACTAACDEAKATACELLGDLHAVEEGLPSPEYSAGPAARAWERGCALGSPVACEKRMHLLDGLSRACKTGPPRACVLEGMAIAEQEGEGNSERADALYRKACDRGWADGCFQSGELHYGWEPTEAHDAIARRAYLKACQLGSAEGCCAVIARYEAEGNFRAAAHVQRQSSVEGLGCGSGRPVGRTIRAQVEVEFSTSGEAPHAEVAEQLQLRFSRGARGCNPASSGPKAAFAVRLSVNVQPDGQVSDVAVTGAAELAPCLERIARALAYGSATQERQFFIRLSYAAVRPEN
jgi:hypothetical protein